MIARTLVITTCLLVIHARSPFAAVPVPGTLAMSPLGDFDVDNWSPRQTLRSIGQTVVACAEWSTTHHGDCVLWRRANISNVYSALNAPEDSASAAHVDSEAVIVELAWLDVTAGQSMSGRRRNRRRRRKNNDGVAGRDARTKINVSLPAHWTTIVDERDALCLQTASPRNGPSICVPERAFYAGDEDKLSRALHHFCTTGMAPSAQSDPSLCPALVAQRLLEERFLLRGHREHQTSQASPALPRYTVPSNYLEGHRDEEGPSWHVLLVDLPTLTKPELWRDILAILSALTHQPSGTNRTYIAALIEVSGHFDSVKQIQLVKNMEDVAASEQRLQIVSQLVGTDAAGMSSISMDLKRRIRQLAFADAFTALNGSVASIVSFVPVDYYFFGRGFDHSQGPTFPAALAGASMWLQAVQSMCANSRHVDTDVPVCVAKAQFVIQLHDSSPQQWNPGVFPRLPQHLQSLDATLSWILRLFELSSGKLALVTSDKDLLQDLLARQARQNSAGQLQLWWPSLSDDMAVHNAIHLPPWLFERTQRMKPAGRSNNIIIPILWDSALESASSFHKSVWGAAILGFRTPAVSNTRTQLLVERYKVIPDEHGSFGPDIACRPQLLATTAVAVDTDARFRSTNAICVSFNRTRLPHGPRLYFNGHQGLEYLFTDTSSASASYVEYTGSMSIDLSQFDTNTFWFDITNSRYGSQSVSLQVDVQPSLPHWRLGNAKSGGRVFRQSHPPAWDALCAPKQDTANPNFPPLAQILRSLEQLHDMQYSMSITRTPLERPRALMRVPRLCRIELSPVSSQSDSDAETSDSFRGRQRDPVGSLALAKTHKTGTETIKSMLLDLATLNRWSVLDARESDLRKVCSIETDGRDITVRLVSSAERLRHQFQVSVGHVEMTETMRQCLELLLAPPTRYITAVRRPLPRSQSHFRFDNLFSWQFRKLPPPRGFEQSTGNLTYSEWYLKFGRDVLLPNSGWEYVRDVETIWVNNHMSHYLGLVDDATVGHAELHENFLHNYDFAFVTEVLGLTVDLFLCTELLSGARQFTCGDAALNRISKAAALTQSTVGIHSKLSVLSDTWESQSSAHLNRGANTANWSIANSSAEAAFSANNAVDESLYDIACDRFVTQLTQMGNAESDSENKN